MDASKHQIEETASGYGTFKGVDAPKEDNARMQQGGCRDEHDASSAASVSSSTFTLVSTLIGGGVLALPFAVASVGLIGGTLLLLGMGAVSAYSAALLVAW